jgi:PAS domain S-box-containing protein
VPELDAVTNSSAEVDVATLSAIVESAPDGILVVDRTGEITFANGTAEALFGFERGALIGERIERLVPIRFRPNHEIDRAEYLEEPHARPMGVGLQLRALCSDGSEVDVDVSLAPLRVNGAQLVVAAVRDASLRRKAEEDHRELVMSMERQLERERVAADLHDDLLQSVYAIGLGFLESERDETVSKEAALSRGRAQITGALADLRSYVGWLRASHSDSSEPAVASRVRALTRTAPEGLEWTVELSLPPEGLPVEYRRPVYLVSKELISNVHRHSNASEAKIELSLIDKAVRVRVEDNGHGFLPEEVSPESFGLHGVRQRVDSLGGDLRLTSLPGKGTEVAIRIPLR